MKTRVASAVISAFIVLLFNSCVQNDSSSKMNTALVVAAMVPPCDASAPYPSYYQLTLNLDDYSNHYELGLDYGSQILTLVPNYEEIVDWYLKIVSVLVPYESLRDRAVEIKDGDQIPEDYQEEIDGLASVCTGTEDKAGDGKLSINEVYMLQLLPDIFVSTQCSSVSVFGASSDTGHTIIGRNLEWFAGFPHNYLSLLQAVVTIKNAAPYDVCLIGYLGFIGCITGFNNQGLFGSIHVSDADKSLYDATGKGSYNMNLRYTLENYNSVSTAGNYLTTLDSTDYAAGHLFDLADPDEAQVFEYDPGPPVNKGIREWDSTLRGGVTLFDHDYTIGAVNSCVLPGFYDNHRGNNVSRWDHMKEQLDKKFGDIGTPDTVTVNELKDVITNFQGRKPGAVDGDLYRGYIQQTFIYQPGLDLAKAEVHFHPLCDQSPGVPGDTDFFVIVKAAFD
ncbi:MAG: hypothetical protein A2176_05530 [Spirochaetes bacterium RBG_13_51_14]|nr:MAG: hypothetical protein A2176_05530 [Spirochaetes bacterium RBG_13_51_14]